jgi:hypothetical protein
MIGERLQAMRQEEQRLSVEYEQVQRVAPGRFFPGCTCAGCRQLAHEQSQQVGRIMPQNRGDQNRGGSFSTGVIGDISCANNARSPYLRCAVNPKAEDCATCQKHSRFDAEPQDIQN